jgi:sorbitol-specific phosphotransferase system component IIC
MSLRVEKINLSDEKNHNIIFDTLNHYATDIMGGIIIIIIIISIKYYIIVNSIGGESLSTFAQQNLGKELAKVKLLLLLLLVLILILILIILIILI